MKIIISCSLIIVLSLLFIEFGISQKVAIIGKASGAAAYCSYFLHKIIPGIKIDIYNHQPEKDTTFTGIRFNSHNVYINDLIKEKGSITENRDNIEIIKDVDKCYDLDIEKYVGYELFQTELEVYAKMQLEIFKQIYSFQKNGRTFKTVRELLKSLSPDFENYFINETTESLLFIKNPLIAANHDIQKYINGKLALYFSHKNVHGFVGLASLMFSEIIEKQLSPEYDNLFIESLYHKDDVIIKKDITIIFRENNKNCIVSMDGKQTSYDFIILATTTAAEINFIDFADLVKPFKYRDSHTVHVTGHLLKKFTKISKDFGTICDRQANLIYTQIPLRQTYAYLITGTQPISESDIRQYMKSYKLRGSYLLHAPPDYSKSDDESLQNARFELSKNLYNAHAMHSLSVIDEMLAIGAKNIALLIKNRIEEIGTFSDEQNCSAERTNSSSVFEQKTNQTFDESRTSAGRASSRSTVVKQRTKRLESEKSRANRKKSNKKG